jgi:hypothetical protein
METGASVKVTYWAEQKAPGSLYDLEGVDEFRDELAADYLSVVHARPGGLGGLHQLAVEFVSHISLADVARFLSQGIAFDLLKSGTKAFVLRPFLCAYRKLRDRNKDKNVDIEELTITFQDSSLIIHKILGDGIFSSLENILLSIAANYDSMRVSSGEPPFEVHVPVFEDATEDRICRFRVMLDVDETIPKITRSDYLKLWGLWYDYSRTYRVYDVERRALIDAEFYTLDRYWSAWEARRRERR